MLFRVGQERDRFNAVGAEIEKFRPLSTKSTKLQEARRRLADARDAGENGLVFSLPGFSYRAVRFAGLKKPDHGLDQDWMT